MHPNPDCIQQDKPAEIAPKRPVPRAAIGPECVKTLTGLIAWNIDIRWLSNRMVSAARRIASVLEHLAPLL